MPRLIEWDRLEFRINGERIAQMIGDVIEAKKIPVTSLFLEFRDDELLIEGKAKKGLTIPFEATVRSVRPDNGWLRIRIEEASAFGLPVPAFLQKFIEGGVKDGSVRYDLATSELLVDIGRRIPGFLDVAIDTVRIVKGGIAIALGTGGTDIPQKKGAELRDETPKAESQ